MDEFMTQEFFYKALLERGIRGDTYGAPVPYRGLVIEEEREIRASNGVLAVAFLTIYTKVDNPIESSGRVIYEGREVPILSARRHQADSFPETLEVICQ